MRRVNKVIVLRQTEVKFSEIQKGDIFALEIQEDSQPVKQTDWAVALEDVKKNPSDHKELFVPSDKVYFIIGKPEISNIILHESEMKKNIQTHSVRELQ